MLCHQDGTGRTGCKICGFHYKAVQRARKKSVGISALARLAPTPERLTHVAVPSRSAHVQTWSKRLHISACLCGANQLRVGSRLLRTTICSCLLLRSEHGQRAEAVNEPHFQEQRKYLQTPTLRFTQHGCMTSQSHMNTEHRRDIPSTKYLKAASQVRKHDLATRGFQHPSNWGKRLAARPAVDRI